MPGIIQQGYAAGRGPEMKMEKTDMEIMEKKTTYIVYSQKMAGYLMQRGFVLVDMQPDKKHPRRNVFFFYETPELKAARDDYMTGK